MKNMKNKNKLSLVKIVDKEVEWKEAISIGVNLLVDNEIATNKLTEAIIESTNKFGPYYVLIPKVALAHAEPNTYNKSIGLSLVLFKKAVEFGKEERHKVNLLFTLSAIDGNSHIKILTKFAEILSKKEIVDNAINCDTEEKLLEIFKELF